MKQEEKDLWTPDFENMGMEPIKTSNNKETTSNNNTMSQETFLFEPYYYEFKKIQFKCNTMKYIKSLPKKAIFDYRDRFGKHYFTKRRNYVVTTTGIIKSFPRNIKLKQNSK